MLEPATTKRVAEAVARAMYARDHAARTLGMIVDEVGPGFARLSMTVRDDMVNGHDMCHGGITFALADTAFAYACNARNDVAVAASCTITYTNPAKRGDRLTAECVERFHRGRTGVYDVTVIDQEGQVIALFRGNSRNIGGKVIPDLEEGS